jgi:hypothetical protein
MAVEVWIRDVIERIQDDYDTPKDEHGDPL